MKREIRTGTGGRGAAARVRATLAAALVALTATACFHHAVQLANLDADALFARAMSEYRGHHWDDAVSAFQQFTFRFPSSPRIQEARYMLAEAYFGKKEYVTAAHEFARLADDYPSGNYADDARFQVCISYARLSPDVELDQEYSQAAIDHCQSLLAYYPNSEHADSAKAIITKMRGKLARKLYIGGEYYFRRNAYDSAIIYFEDVVKKYPETPAAPDALLRVVQSYRKRGWTEEAEAAKERLLATYPNSQAARAVEGGTGATAS